MTTGSTNDASSPSYSGSLNPEEAERTHQMGIEARFDVPFVAKLTSEEKQIQQSYRPVIGVHKWFARRPGALFRSLVLSEFSSEGALRDGYYRSHEMHDVTIGDPFMGGGTTLFESNRVGCCLLYTSPSPRD